MNKNPGQPDRVSTSQVVDAAFQPGSGIESVVQQGNVAYVDGGRKAWGDLARYTPADQSLAPHRFAARGGRRHDHDGAHHAPESRHRRRLRRRRRQEHVQRSETTAGWGAAGFLEPDSRHGPLHDGPGHCGGRALHREALACGRTRTSWKLRRSSSTATIARWLLMDQASAECRPSRSQLFWFKLQ